MNRFGTSDSMTTRKDLLGAGGQRGPQGYASQSEDYVERQNDDKMGELGEKIKALKAVTIEISNEVREQNRFLDGMESDFSRTSGLLGKTMKNLDNLAKSPHGRQMCYLMMFVIFVFMVAYFLTR